MKSAGILFLMFLVTVSFCHCEENEKVVLVVLDGAGMMDLDLGVTGECEAVFPTLTRPNHASLLTGVYPETHGILGNEYWDNGKKKYTEIEAVTLFEILEAHGKESVVIAKENICELFGRYCTYIVAEDPERIFSLIREELRTKDFIVVNISILDRLGHKYGPESDEVEDAKKELRNLFAEHPFDAVTIVTADHGMSEISKVIEITKYLQDYDTIAVPQGRICFIYSDTDEEIDFQIEGVAQVIERAEYPTYRIDHKDAPDLMLTAEKGYAFLPSPLLTEYRGMHGSLEEKTVFITTNHKKEGAIECTMVDIAPWILEIFGIESDHEFDGERPEIMEAPPEEAQPEKEITVYIALGALMGIGVILLIIRRG